MADARCPKCGKALESSGADCPACLLGLALEASSGNDEPTPPESGEEGRRQRLEAGARVGPYTIVRELGEGGMGIVYLAEQTEPIKRRVALKVIKHGMDTEQVVKRFEAERQALALMDHVAIAKVFEAGETDTGRPYFAMEFIDGAPITDYCDRKRLQTGDRLSLFSRACEGVQHAHRRGIIHRDIKPSNVLVAEIDGEAQPKIIDFGVAKATEQSLTEHSAMTAMGVLLGTPEYMSPEQAELAPFDIDTRTDVYSLGVLLYELLTGALPFDRRALQKAAFDEVRRHIREVQPSKPSTRISQLGEKATGLASSRHTDVSSLRRRLAGDLDLIAMKALEKERDRRYGSPAELADDIQRHLCKEPILARPPSIPYQLRKLASRNPLASGLAATVLILLVVSATVMAFQNQRIRAERDRTAQEAKTAESVSLFLQELFTSNDPRIARGEEITVRSLLDKGTSRAETGLVNQPVVKARLLVLLANIYDSLGHRDEALRLLDEAGTMTDVMESESGLDLQRLINLTWVHRREGRIQEALEFARQALDRAEASLAPDDPNLAEALRNMGMLLRDDNQMEEAREYLERSREVALEYQGEDSADEAWALYHLGWLEYRTGRAEEALPHYERACSILEKEQGDDSPGVAQCFTDHASVLQWLRRFDEAAEKHRRSFEIRERVLPADHPDLADAVAQLGTVLYYDGDYENAELHYRRALEILERSVGSDHPDFGRMLTNIGLVRRDIGDYEQAETYFLRGLALIEPSAGPDDSSVIKTLLNLAGVYAVQRRTEALPIYDRITASRERTHGPEHPWVVGSLMGKAKLLSRLERHAEAATLYERALEISAANFPPENVSHGRLARDAARTYARLGRMQEARALVQANLDAIEGSETREEALALALYAMAWLDRYEGQDESADTLLEQAIEVRTEYQSEDHASLLYVQAIAWSHGGKKEAALEALGRALAGGYPVDAVDRVVDFAPLRRDPDFLALLE